MTTKKTAQPSTSVFADPPAPIRFPEDEKSHPAVIEWWYFNGHLWDEVGRRYSYMNCLFKADNKKVGIPHLRYIPLKTVHFAHSIVADVDARTAWPLTDDVVAVSTDSFRKPLLFLNYTQPIAIKGYVNCELEETEPFRYRLKTGSLDLRLRSRKPPLLVGGQGYLDLHGRTTYYYSLTRMDTEGEIVVDGERKRVRGVSWMDHQWANTAYAKDAWSWFSLQLDGDTELMCVAYENDGKPAYFTCISRPDGSQEHTEELVVKPLGDEWKSPVSKASYPIAWSVEIPGKDIRLTVSAPFSEQEMIFGLINYWEGALDVQGTIEGKAVQGVGFLELVGRPSKLTSLRAARGHLDRSVKAVASLFKS